LHNYDETVRHLAFLICGFQSTFTDLSYRSNGLDRYPEDSSRDSIAHLKSDLGKFRVPTLRNIELTGPYMHDGRFNDLSQVLAHYNSGVKNTANLDPELHLLTTSGFSNLNLTYCCAICSGCTAVRLLNNFN